MRCSIRLEYRTTTTSRKQSVFRILRLDASSATETSMTGHVSTHIMSLSMSPLADKYNMHIIIIMNHTMATYPLQNHGTTGTHAETGNSSALRTTG